MKRPKNIRVRDGTPSITDKDYGRSASASMIDALTPILDKIKSQGIRRMCEMGCGYGGVTRFVADYLGTDEVVGLDIDSEVAKDVRKQGIIFHELNLENDSIPYPDGYFDLVISFGVLEHLRYFDPPIQEAKRVLRKGGYLFINIPNLASWIQRVGFLLGYQPRDAEISYKTVPGRLWFYDDYPFNHIHSCTLKAIVGLLNYYNFNIVMVRGGRPLKEYKKWTVWATIIDTILSRRTSLARRINILASR